MKKNWIPPSQKLRKRIINVFFFSEVVLITQTWKKDSNFNPALHFNRASLICLQGLDYASIYQWGKQTHTEGWLGSERRGSLLGTNFNSWHVISRGQPWDPEKVWLAWASRIEMKFRNKGTSKIVTLVMSVVAYKNILLNTKFHESSNRAQWRESK